MQTRRAFAGMLGAAGAVRALPSRRKILLVLVDGLGREYVEKSDMPNFRRMAKEGGSAWVESVLPSVTNVNNASLATASWPSAHGITSNFFYEPRSRRAFEMETAAFLLRPTLLERAVHLGWRTALVATKDKMRTLLSRGVKQAFSAENPPAEWIGKAGPKEDMYSAEVNYWSLRAARQLLTDQADFVYLTTTDYMMHTYPPEHAASQEHLHRLDALLGEIVSEHVNLEVYLTADHGMSAKTEAVDLARVLHGDGIEAEAIPIIRDKHRVHHQNLGGASYIYLEKAAEIARAEKLLKATAGCDEIYDRKTAARKFHLRADRIGDLFVLGSKHIAFGDLDAARELCTVRTHGSRYESHVPALWYRTKNVGRIEYNWQLAEGLHLEDRG